MKAHSRLTVITLAIALLTACTPVPTPAPTATNTPLHTGTPEPTVLPTETPAPSPTPISSPESFSAVQNGLCKWNGIPAANQNLSIEVHISGREDHQNGKKCGVETLKKYPYQDIYAKSLS